MARFVKKLGTAALRYMFELNVHSVNFPGFTSDWEAEVSVVFLRGNKRMESKQKPTVSKEMRILDFKNEKLAIVCSVYKDKQSGQN